MKRLWMALLCLILSGGVQSQEKGWLTDYERSGFKRTPRYAETMDFCRRMDAASPMVQLTSFGKSPQGLDLPLLILDRDGLADPAAIHAAGRILVLVQACIHPGEPEGKDAMLMMIRDMAIEGKFKAILDRVSLIVIPIFNTDGHERFGPYNRINQNGPEETGWRVTANNLNLNRDFLKADATEMKAWLTMFNRWMPDFFIDSHTTDGADYQYALTYLVEVFGEMDDGLTRWTRDNYFPRLESDMKSAGILIFPYVDFRNWHDPRSGLISEVSPPMLSQGYTALRNRPGLLIETHMLKDYKTRVDATYQCILSSLQIFADRQQEYLGLIRNADAFVLTPEFRKQSFPLQFETSMNDSVIVDFQGFSYTMQKSGISGGNWFRYSNTPEVMKIPYFSRTRPTVSITLPAAYIIPPEWSDVIARLELHGIAMKRLKQPALLTVSTYRFKNPKWQQTPYEGRHVLYQFDCEEFSEERLFPAGSVIVEMNQQAARIIPHILEPRGNGSFLSWGMFDGIFEQREYAENYVMEKMAPEMLRKDPALKAEFEQKMAQDTLFARNPQQILFWFYSKTPYFDSRKMIYPVGRIMDEAALRKLETR